MSFKKRVENISEGHIREDIGFGAKRGGKEAIKQFNWYAKGGEENEKLYWNNKFR